jgi:hypothetical protein
MLTEQPRTAPAASEAAKRPKGTLPVPSILDAFKRFCYNAPVSRAERRKYAFFSARATG